jgi:hypothetical protein
MSQILFKKIENCVSIIVWWGLSSGQPWKAYYLISFSRSICPLSILKKSETDISFLSRYYPNKGYKLAVFTSFGPCSWYEKIWPASQTMPY